MQFKLHTREFQIHTFNPCFAYCKQLVKQHENQLSKHSCVLSELLQNKHTSGVPFNLVVKELA